MARPNRGISSLDSEQQSGGDLSTTLSRIGSGGQKVLNIRQTPKRKGGFTLPGRDNAPAIQRGGFGPLGWPVGPQRWP